MDRELLLEIGCEELPASWLPGLTTQVGDVVANMLTKRRLALESPADLNALLLGAKDQDVVFIDEAALIPSEQQHALLIALDQHPVRARTPRLDPAVSLQRRQHSCSLGHATRP